MHRISIRRLAGRLGAVLVVLTLGACDSAPTYPVENPSHPADTTRTLASLAIGEHSCALESSGAAYCWGDNQNGQLGIDTVSMANPRPTAVHGSVRFRTLAVSAVGPFSCGIAQNGAAYCWGSNANGELGDGSTIQRQRPNLVASGQSFTSLAVGVGHVCGLATDGRAWCWGTSRSGAFGDGSLGTHLTPVLGGGGLKWQTLVAGADYTCGIDAVSRAYCWGNGTFGTLGNGQNASSATPVPVAGGITFKTLAGGGNTVCGLSTQGRAFCWGNNFFGTVGDSTSATENGAAKRASPVAVAGGLVFSSLSAGALTVCATTISGAGYCWGYNFGAIGDGSEDHRSTPTAVAGGLSFRQITSGAGFSCGVTTANAAYCWGENVTGSLGDGSVTQRTLPVRVMF